jgi:hypothetical protein
VRRACTGGCCFAGRRSRRPPATSPAAHQRALRKDLVHASPSSANHRTSPAQVAGRWWCLGWRQPGWRHWCSLPQPLGARQLELAAAHACCPPCPARQGLSPPRRLPAYPSHEGRCRCSLRTGRTHGCAWRRDKQRLADAHWRGCASLLPCGQPAVCMQLMHLWHADCAEHSGSLGARRLRSRQRPSRMPLQQQHADQKHLSCSSCFTQGPGCRNSSAPAAEPHPGLPQPIAGTK